RRPKPVSKQNEPALLEPARLVARTLLEVRAMSTVFAPAPRVKARRPKKAPAKPQRFCRLQARPTVDEPVLLTLHIAGKESDYWLSLMPSDFGEAFRLEKIIPSDDGPAERGEVYHVCFEDQQNHTCECKGFLRHGHCKHIDSLKALRDAGKL